MKASIKRSLVFIIPFAVVMFCLVYGINLDDIAEVIANATILCLSCVGIG